MTHEKWQATLQPKVTGTLNLQAVLGDSLDFFIILSSQAGVTGSKGQGNYSAAGAFQDAFARNLSSFKVPVYSIDLGAVRSVGFAFENVGATSHATQQGAKLFNIEELLALLDYAIRNPIPKDAESAQLVLGGIERTNPNSGNNFTERPDPKFSHIWSRLFHKESHNHQTSQVDVRLGILEAETWDEAVVAVQVAVINKLSRLLAMQVEEISPDRSVSSYGTDSLIAVELRNWIGTQLLADVHTFELMSALSITKLASTILERSGLAVPKV